MTTKIVFKNRAEWLAYRQGSFLLGSSNIGAILGLCEYKTPLMIWQEWQERRGQEDKPQLFRGQFMEDGIAQWFEQQTGLRVVKRSAEIAVFHNDKYPDWVECAPDREIFASSADEKSRPILEIKDTTLRIDFDAEDGLPNEWFAQVQFQMAIMGRTCAYLAVNDGSKQMKCRKIEFNAEYAEQIITKAVAWVEKHIIGGEQPAPINGGDVMSLYPQSESGVVKIGKSAFGVFEQAREYKRKAKEFESKFNALESQIKAFFDSRDSLEFEGTTIATYKTINTERFDTKAFADANPAEYAKYLKHSIHRRLTLTK